MELIEYGKIVGTHGIEGELRVFPYSSGFHNFSKITRIYIKDAQSGQSRKFIVESKRIHKKSILLKLSGIDNPETADSFKGVPVYIDKSALSATDEDEYYWFELIGLSVITTEGTVVGTVENLMETPAHDILIVTKDKSECLVPVNDRFIHKIDINKSQITVYPIEGLTV